MEMRFGSIIPRAVLSDRPPASIVSLWASYTRCDPAIMRVVSEAAINVSKTAAAANETRPISVAMTAPPA